MSIYEDQGTAKWEAEISRLAKTSQAFLNELENTNWAVMSFGRVKFGKRHVWLHELLTKALRVFVRISAGYHASVQSSDRRKRFGPRASFIFEIATELKAAGYGISARSSDDLVRVLDLLFDDAGYPVSDTRKTVAHVLDTMGTDHL